MKNCRRDLGPGGCLIIILMPLISSTPAPTQLLVTRAGPCDDGGQPPALTVAELSLVRSRYDSLLSGDLNISRDIDNGWNIRATMQKCHDIRNLDTCDFFKAAAVVGSGCEDSPDDHLYTMFFRYVQPRLECPVRAGAYKIIDFPFNPASDLRSTESKISTSVFGYTYRLEGFDANEDRIVCVDAYLQQLFVRDHDFVGDVVRKEHDAPEPENGDSDGSSEDADVIEEISDTDK